MTCSWHRERFKKLAFLRISILQGGLQKFVRKTIDQLTHTRKKLIQCHTKKTIITRYYKKHSTKHFKNQYVQFFLGEKMLAALGEVSSLCFLKFVFSVF